MAKNYRILTSIKMQHTGKKETILIIDKTVAIIEVLKSATENIKSTVNFSLPANNTAKSNQNKKIDNKVPINADCNDYLNKSINKET